MTDPSTQRLQGVFLFQLHLMHLAADPDVHPATVVDVDEHGLRFDVALMDALGHIGVFYKEIGLGEAALQVAFVECGGVVDGMQDRRVVLQGCERLKILLVARRTPPQLVRVHTGQYPRLRQPRRRRARPRSGPDRRPGRARPSPPGPTVHLGHPRQ